MSGRALMFIMSVWMLSGCSTPPPLIEDLWISPSELAAGGGEVVIRWQTSGAQEVVLSGVDGRLPVDGETRVSVGETFEFELTARSGSESMTRVVTVRVRPASSTIGTLSGRVIDGNGRPVSALVRLADQQAVTAADGTFQIPSVHAPYDVLVERIVDGPQSRPMKYAFIGLASAAPTLTIGRGERLNKENNAMATGTIEAHRDAEWPLTSRTDLYVVGQSGGFEAALATNELRGNLDMTVSWSGAASTSGHVVAWRAGYSEGDLSAKYLEGVVIPDVAFEAGKTTPLEVVLGPIRTGKLNANVNIPKWAQGIGVSWMLAFPTGDWINDLLVVSHQREVSIEAPEFGIGAWASG